MPSIDEILNNLGVDDEVTKVASSEVGVSEEEVEKQAAELGLIGKTVKTASKQNGGDPNMNLQDFYDIHFGNRTKVAAAQQPVQKTFTKEASALEALGEKAGEAFSNALYGRLVEFTVKTAMDAAPDSEATKDIQSGAGVIPSATVANPQLEVNRGESDDEGIDTTPEHYDLLSKAIAKKQLEAALESGEPGELSHQVFSVDMGLEMPKSQQDA